MPTRVMAKFSEKQANIVRTLIFMNGLPSRYLVAKEDFDCIDI